MEIVGRIVSRCQDKGFFKISEPFTYGGEGPFIFALGILDSEFHAFCFELADTERFLADPSATPAAYTDPVFFDSVENHIDLNLLHHAMRHFSLILQKVLVDSPACRQAVQALWSTHPKEASRILLLFEDGSWHTGKDVLSLPVLLS